MTARYDVDDDLRHLVGLLSALLNVPFQLDQRYDAAHGRQQYRIFSNALSVPYRFGSTWRSASAIVADLSFVVACFDLARAKNPMRQIPDTAEVERRWAHHRERLGLTP